MSKKLILLLLLLPVVCDGKTIMASDGPIAIEVGEQEIKVQFEDPVKPWLRSLNGDQYLPNLVDIINTNSYMLLRAKKPFDWLRVKVQNKRTGELILLDLTYSETPENVVIKTKSHESEKSSEALKTTVCRDVGCLQDPRAKLIRYGFQRHFAPPRVVEHMPGVLQTKSAEKITIPKGFSGKTLEAFLLGNYKLLVVEVKNTSNHQASIDPRNIYAMNISMVSSYQWALNAKGKAGDRTLMFVVLEV